MKKILFDIREIENNKYTGISRFILSILKNRTYFKNFEFILISNTETNLERCNLENCKQFAIREDIPIISEQVSIHKLLHQIKPDIYLSPYYKYPIFCNIPVVISLFDLTYLILGPYKKKIKNKLYVKNFIKYFSLKKSRFIITSSQNTAKDIVSFFNVQPDRIKVIYLPIGNSFKPQSEITIKKVMEKYHIRKKYILYVGNDNYHKNVKTLYRAYEILPAQLKKEYILILIGFKDIAKKYPSAVVLDNVDDETLKSFYSGCSLFVYPSLYEGFGYPPLEALACGANVISSNTSCLPEILNDWVEYFEPLDYHLLSKKITNILEKGEKIRKIDLSKYSEENFLISISDLLKEVS